MSTLTRNTKIMLIAPIMYAVFVTIFFVIILQNEAIQPHHYVGILITELAFLLWTIARIQLGNAFSITAKADFMVTTGLYSKFRHPVYYFSILTGVGIATFIWSTYLIMPILLLILVQLIRIRQEEKVLTKALGKKYLTYKHSTWF